MCFGMAHMGNRGNFGFDFFFPCLKDDMEPLSCKLRMIACDYHLWLSLLAFQATWCFDELYILIPMRCLPAWCACCCHVPSTSDCVTLLYAVAAVNPEELLWAAIRGKKHDTVYYCNYKLSAVSRITQWESPITQSFRGNRFFPREWQTSILFKNMSFLTLKDSLIAHQIKNKCLRLTFTSFLKKGPISLYNFIICSFLYVPLLLTRELLTMVPSIKMSYLPHLFLERFYPYFVANIKWHLLQRTISWCLYLK